MFIDLSGFTPLTEAFMKQGIVGAEQLSIRLNGIFAPLVKLVYQRHGFIPYFAGDAFTAIFPLETTPVSVDDILQTALDVQAFFEREGTFDTKFGSFQIGIKIGISVGTVEWGIVGDQQQSFFFRGPAINQSALAQTLAQEQEIIFDAAFSLQVPTALITFDAISKSSFFKLKHIDAQALNNTPIDNSFDKQLSLAEQKALARFIPRSVLRFSELGEFRSVISIFIAFKNVHTYDLLNQFSTIVLEQIHNFSGYFKEIDFGDKGGVMVAFIGAPVSFENNVDRALEFTLALDAETKQLQKTSQLEYKIGITEGTAFTGNIGGVERVQYAVVGTQVNLAARLMTYADWGEVSVDIDIQKDKNFRFRHKGDIRYKGIAQDIPTFTLEGKATENQQIFNGIMVGRTAELQQLEDFIDPIWKDEKMRIVYVYGEAGIGKSRLIYELMKRLETEAVAKNPPERPLLVKWVSCQADQILQKPFNPFIYFLKNYFNQSTQLSSKQNLVQFEDKFQMLIEELVALDDPVKKENGQPIVVELRRTKSILAALIGLNVENSLWNQLDAKGRYQNTLLSLSNLFLAESSLQPLIIELEDAHWFDESSKAFLDEFIRNIRQLPVLLLVTSRYLDDGSKPTLIQKDKITQYDIPVLKMDLNILKTEALQAFAETYLEGSISQEFLKLLKRTTNGNPFYLEQILEYFSESNLLIQKDEVWHIKDKNIKISNSINAILMARVDRLSALVKETVKAAAVIGREFEVPVLSEVLKTQDAFIRRNEDISTVLHEQIQTAERGQIWRAMNELRYIFKHSLLRETVYDMQLRTRLRQLHKLIGEAIEHVYPDQIESRYVDLAFHYEQAEVWDKAKIYLAKAAEYAKRNFQNKQAIRFYDKTLSLINTKTERTEYIKILLRKGSLLELTGDWENCELTYTLALESAMFSNEKVLEARVNNSLGKLLMLKGNYEDARSHLETALNTFESIGDILGITKSYGNLGNLFFRQGQYDQAKEYFENSIHIGRTLPYTTATAQIVSNLGLTHMNQGNYLAGIQCQEEQLVLAQQQNDKQGMATLFTNLGIVLFEKGDYDAALESYEKGLELSQELGNKFLMSIAIGCIGSVYERKGDYEKARENFEYDLDLVLELGDKQGIAIVHGLLGNLYALKGDFDLAIPNLEKQLQLCKELHYQKGIAKALNTLGDVYSFKQAYERSVNFYDQAIEVTRKIDNKLVLGTSLIEKALTLIYIQQLDEAHALQQEAQEIADQLGNQDLIFEAHRLAIRIATAKEDTDTAIQLLKSLAPQITNIRQEASVVYEWSKIDPSYKPKALALYQQLYKETPMHLYGLRIMGLESSGSLT